MVFDQIAATRDIRAEGESREAWTQGRFKPGTIARVLPVWPTISLALGMEPVVDDLIRDNLPRDNLTLNIIMLIYPADWIIIWQGGA